MHELNEAAIRTTFDLIKAPAYGVTWFAKGPDGLTSAGCANSAETLVKWCNALPTWDHFVCPNPSGVGRKPAKADIKAVNWWVIDIDQPLGTSAWMTADAVIEMLWDMLARPFNIAHRKAASGRGVHIWLPLHTTTVDTPESVDRCIKGATRELHKRIKNGDAIDLSCADISHVFRLPGSINSKNGDPATWVTETEGLPAIAVYELEQWSIPPLGRQCAREFLQGQTLAMIGPALPPAISNFLCFGTDVGSRHRLLYAAAKTLHEYGFDSKGATGLLRQALKLSGSAEQPEFWEREVARVVRQVWRNP